ncbi:unnamed protein product [Microthlaspi erraticum]|uniref:Uncharacterized protein n=1 Tax=Microthlaspi erraticum TaxID=1685480 RepID=A0A6D2JF13_9BRAS|nr:unnamed protein product [Microthlaspi erraticum]
MHKHMIDGKSVGSGPSKKLSPPFQVVNRVFRFSGYSGLYSCLGSLTLGRISGFSQLSAKMVDMITMWKSVNLF